MGKVLQVLQQVAELFKEVKALKESDAATKKAITKIHSRLRALENPEKGK